MCVIKQKPSPAAAAAPVEPQPQATKKPAVQAARDGSRLGAAGNASTPARKKGRGTLLTGGVGVDTSGQKTLLGQ